MSLSDEFSDKCKICKNEILGRYIRAAKDIRAGDILLEEKPIIIVPQSDDNLFCSNCFNESSKICKKCNIFPLCTNCMNHNDFECNFFLEKSQDKFDNDFLKKYPKTFSIIKCLLFMEMDNKNTNGKIWKKFMDMESHINERKNTNIWINNQKQIIEPIINLGIYKFFKCNNNDNNNNEEINEEYLQKICGILDVNTFELRGPSNKLLRGIYLNASLLAHSCTANTMITVDGKYNMKIYATIDINGNEIIYNNYTNPLLGTNERREHLKIGKYFICECERCKDPTEFGTYLNALICKSCNDNDGYLLYHYDRDIWKCNKCSNIKESNEVKKILIQIQEEICKCNMDLHKLESLIKKYEKILYPKHYLIIDIKQIIASKLRQICDDNTNNNVLLLKRKIEICEEILFIIKKLQPGISRLKAITLYEYFTPLYELIDQEYENDQITENEYLEKLKLCENILKESLDILAYEPINTPEGQLTRRGLMELKELRDNIKYVEKELRN